MAQKEPFGVISGLKHEYSAKMETVAKQVRDDGRCGTTAHGTGHGANIHPHVGLFSIRSLPKLRRRARRWYLGF